MPFHEKQFVARTFALTVALSIALTVALTVALTALLGVPRAMEDGANGTANLPCLALLEKHCFSNKTIIRT